MSFYNILGPVVEEISRGQIHRQRNAHESNLAKDFTQKQLNYIRLIFM